MSNILGRILQKNFDCNTLQLNDPCQLFGVFTECMLKGSLIILVNVLSPFSDDPLDIKLEVSAIDIKEKRTVTADASTSSASTGTVPTGWFYSMSYLGRESAADRACIVAQYHFEIAKRLFHLNIRLNFRYLSY